MTLVDTSGGRAMNRKQALKSLVNTSGKVAPSSKVRDSSDYTRIKRVIQVNKKMKADADASSN
jgi:hypothetical protein